MAFSKRIAFAVAGAALFTGVGIARGQTAGATTTTTTTVKSGVVVYASGNTLIVKESDGVTREHTVPEGFNFQMGGKNVTLADLKPGDKISAVITDVKSVEPATVTRVVKGTVVESSLGSILVRNSKGQLIKYSSKDEQGKDVKIIRDGKQVALSDLKAGDQLSATIITRLPPQVSTLRSVDATVTRAPAPAPAPAPAAPVVADAAPAKPAKLPKTGSPLPLIGLLGGLFLAAGAALRLRRRAGA